MRAVTLSRAEKTAVPFSMRSARTVPGGETTSVASKAAAKAAGRSVRVEIPRAGVTGPYSSLRPSTALQARGKTWRDHGPRYGAHGRTSTASAQVGFQGL